MDSKEMNKGGFAASAELQRQRQEARDAKLRAVQDVASTAELIPVPAGTPTVNGGAPLAKPLPEKADAPPIELRITE